MPICIHGDKIFSHQDEKAFCINLASINDSEMKRTMAVPSGILTACQEGSTKATQHGRSQATFDFIAN